MGTELKIDLGEEEVRSLVAEGILAILTDEKREELIRGAIAHLLEDSVERRKLDGSYNKEKVSRFRLAWERAAEDEMHKVIRDQIKGSKEIQDKFKELFNRAMVKFFMDHDKVEKVASSMAESFAKQFNISDY